MNVLEDIQRNTSEFNIKFHMMEFVGRAIVQVFMSEENRKQIEELMKIETKPYDLKAFMIGQAFREMADLYLSTPMESEDDD